VSIDAVSTALMDNTTIHGAVAAYHQWPPTPSSWRGSPYAINLRSLMDVIEAIVLFDRIMLDGACNSLADPMVAGGVDPRKEWPPFKNLRDPCTGSLIFGLEHFSSRESVIGAGILATAAERLQRSVADDHMRYCAESFQNIGMRLAIPRFYDDSANFATLTRRSFSRNAISSVAKDIQDLETIISRQESSVADFAMFAFRGFYYEELAHLLSMVLYPAFVPIGRSGGRLQARTENVLEDGTRICWRFSSVLC